MKFLDAVGPIAILISLVTIVRKGDLSHRSKMCHSTVLQCFEGSNGAQIDVWVTF